MKMEMKMEMKILKGSSLRSKSRSSLSRYVSSFSSLRPIFSNSVLSSPCCISLSFLGCLLSATIWFMTDARRLVSLLTYMISFIFIRLISSNSVSGALCDISLFFTLATTPSTTRIK